MVFEWDSQKETKNIRNHGVDFSEASTSFADPLKIEVYDDEHSVNEDRFILVGISFKGKLLVVSFVERSDEVIRIISARKATKKEIEYYNRQNKP